MIGYDPKELAKIYDGKTADAGDINALLARKDKRFFNHNGIVLYAQSLRTPSSEEDLLEMLHKLEADLVEYSIRYLGTVLKEHILLDAGCGAGGTSLMIHEAFGCRIEGVTLSPKQAEFATKAAELYGFSDSVRFFIGDILQLPCEGNYYDIIWACESTEHLPDLDAMYNGFRRVTKPSGRLVIVTWCATDSPLGMSIKPKVDNHYKTNIHTREEYLKHAKRNGWTIDKQIDMTDMTAPYWKLRSTSEHRTGSETFMAEGFGTGALEYYLFTFDREK